MAEFCVDCWNKIMESNEDPKTFTLSPYLDLCEGCGQYKPVIISIKRRYFIRLWFSEHFPRKSRSAPGRAGRKTRRG